jgi:hypothetical protein
MLLLLPVQSKNSEMMSRMGTTSKNHNPLETGFQVDSMNFQGILSDTMDPGKNSPPHIRGEKYNCLHSNNLVHMELERL